MHTLEFYDCGAVSKSSLWSWASALGADHPVGAGALAWTVSSVRLYSERGGVALHGVADALPAIEASESLDDRVLGVSGPRSSPQLRGLLHNPRVLR